MQRGVPTEIQATGNTKVLRPTRPDVSSKATNKKGAKSTDPPQSWYAYLTGSKEKASAKKKGKKDKGEDDEEHRPLLEEEKSDEQKQKEEDDEETKNLITMIKNLTGLFEDDPEDST